MKDIVEFISPLVESQFPSFYREEGPKFIAFVKSYYEWLEQSNNVISHARNLLKYRDVDKTAEDFLVYFKEEYLKNIQFDTATDKRLLIKNALDFYRAKGTERSIDLFFKLVFAQPAKVRYPGDDILKLSDNSWKQSRYIEITETAFNKDFEGKAITGLNSGATAYVESFSIKKKINNAVDNQGNPVKISKNINILFITNIIGTFLYGEKVVFKDLNPVFAPIIIGSLNGLQIIAGGSNYQIGDTVLLESNTGINGKAIVTSTINTTGEVEFKLIEGGWGFSLSPEVLVSERVLVINNVSISNSSSPTFFQTFESLVQPKANIDFDSMTGGTFNSNDYIYVYYANNTLAGTGKIISINVSEDFTQGNAYVSIMSGNLEANATFYNFDNTVYANTTIYTDRTARANIIANTANADFVMTSINNAIIFVKGEKIFQANSTVELASGIVDLVERNGANLSIKVSNISGVFVPNTRTYGSISQADANLFSYSTRLGILDFSSTQISSIVVEANGTGYVNGDFIRFISNTGFGAAARIYTDGAGAIANVRLYNYGRRYLNAPTVIIPNTVFTYFFNANSDVSSADNFITLSGHTFSNTDQVIYTVSAGNIPLSGLSNNTTYYVRTSNTSGITVSNAPAGNIIDITAGLNENGHSFSSTVSPGNGAVLYATLGKEFDLQNDMFVYGENSNTHATIIQVGDGNLADFRIISLDDEETVNVTPDFIKNYNYFGIKFLDLTLNDYEYGFLANPAANLSFAIGPTFTDISMNIGSISLLSVISPGKDYTLDPLVNVYEPIIYGYKKQDYVINIEDSTTQFALNENLLYSNNNINFSTLAKIKEIVDENTIIATRTSLLADISEVGNSFIKGETSNTSSKIITIQESNTFSGFNANVSANVVTANGVVSKLSIIDSGFGYDKFDILSFVHESNERAGAGIAKAIVETEGQAEGYYQNNKGFLSADKYLHDGDYYQEYSYEIISRIPFEKYFDMLKRVLHVAGTKMFTAVEIESKTLIGITAAKTIEIYKSFNPFIDVNTSTNFITIQDNNFANSELVVYTVGTGNTVVNGLTNNQSYYIAYANSTGFKLSTDVNGSSIVNLTGPLLNEIGHEIHNII